MKCKKTALPGTGETVKVEGTSLIPPHHGREKSVFDSGSTIIPIPTSMAPTRVPSPSANFLTERPKHEKTKINLGGHFDGAKISGGLFAE